MSVFGFSEFHIRILQPERPWKPEPVLLREFSILKGTAFLGILLLLFHFLSGRRK